MKNTFKEFYEISNNEKRKLLSKAVIVLDTNVLLNLYRYSKSTRDGWLNTLKQLKERIHIPYIVGLEYQKNRLKVIHSEEKDDKQTEKEIDTHLSKFIGLIEQRRKYSETISNIREKIENLKQTIKENHKEHPDYKKADLIRNQYDIIFKNSIGEKFTENEIEEISKKGKERFKNKTPPGYEDYKKEENIDGTGKYGDLVIWESIINFAKENKTPIIFVTDDDKEDWWTILNNKIISPRIELIKEFQERTQQQYYQYSPKQFLRYINDHLEEKIDKESIEETEIKSTASRLSSLEKYIRNMIRTYRHNPNNGELFTELLNYINSKGSIISENEAIEISKYINELVKSSGRTSYFFDNDLNANQLSNYYSSSEIDNFLPRNSDITMEVTDNFTNYYIPNNSNQSFSNYELAINQNDGFLSKKCNVCGKSFNKKNSSGFLGKHELKKVCPSCIKKYQNKK
ncbi:PIN domain-containing protein [Halobacteriovorax sp. ZH5_bin.2]|uniref:PIN domain-containing protein n=1 Tax=Halobacteriovorax sp. ZH5_bin.2 TaxID=3157727 RepID=UPI00371E527B